MLLPRITLSLAWLLLTPGFTIMAGDSWATALAGMPLAQDSPELNRTNAISIMLNSLKPAGEVKGLVFLPAATDELYLIKRLNPHLPTASGSLLDAVNAITNGSCIRCSWQAPFVLVHTEADVLDPIVTETANANVRQTKQTQPSGRLLCLDADWDTIHQLTRKHLSIQLRPPRGSSASWHFYRHNLVGWNLKEPEIVRALALAGKTSVRLDLAKGLFGSQLRAEFYPDTRTSANP